MVRWEADLTRVPSPITERSIRRTVKYAGLSQGSGVSSDYIGTAIQTLSGAITGAGALTMSGNGALVLTNSGNTYSGDTTVSSGTLNLQNTTAAQNSVVNLNGGSLIFTTA